jgi:patatin-like phospholipase/acyl hydrolase
MKYILQLDGGGILGTIPASILTDMENQLGIKVVRKFDLISGTSTGAILGSALAMGAPAFLCRQIYVEKGKELFIPRSKWNPLNWGRPKYDRQPIVDELKRIYNTMGNENPEMGNTKVKFMSTSVSLVDERTHYFKSWDNFDEHRKLIDVVVYSFAAAYYFGAVVDDKEQQVWADGGEGQDNCTIRQCFIEALRQKWLPNEPVKILSLGCGYAKSGYSFEEAKKTNIIQQAKFYLNLAERQSATDQQCEANELGNVMPLSLLRLDSEIPAEYNHLDAVEYIDYFDKLGKKIFSDNKDKILKFLDV